MFFTDRKKKSLLVMTGIFCLCFLFGGALKLRSRSDTLTFTGSSGYMWKGDYVYGAYADETVQDLIDATDSTMTVRVRVRTANNRYIANTAILRTGLRIQYYMYSTVWNEALLVMKGDISGDGMVSSTDYLQLKQHFNGDPLSGAYFEAGDIDGNRRLLSSDYLLLKRYFSGQTVLFPEKNLTVSDPVAYEGPYSEVNGTYGGVDDLGREQYYETQTAAGSQDKEVGIFYFLWQGMHGSNKKIYDNSKIVAADPTAIQSEENWVNAGGGGRIAQHFWGEPLFGYYISGDEWVMRKHVQMLTLAGIDYLIFDVTNAYTYDAQALKLFAILDEYYQQGWDVPKFAYMTHSYSNEVMQTLYENIYVAHPEYSHLWYQYNGKPLIIGDEPTDDVSAFFTVKDSQWPTETKKDNGFPWIEFSRWLQGASVYGVNGAKELMSVSVAQQNATGRMSTSAWYGGNDRVRSYKGSYYKSMTDEEAMLYGTNYEMGFDYAMLMDPANIFITGWNEWMAQRQAPYEYPIAFVDCADTDASRDIEPMNGVLKDNYYMQTANFVKAFKNSAARVYVGDSTTIDITGSFSQWDTATARYTDFENDTVDRNTVGFGKTNYVDTSGRNDFVSMKVAKDADTIYFYVKTKESITAPDDEQWMNLFLRSGVAGNGTWEGFDYVINRTAPSNGKMTVEKCTGGWNWEVVGTVSYKMEGNELMLAVPRSLLGIASGAPVDLQFKWVDHCEAGNVMSFYTKGDAAPYGRFTYIYSEVAR